MTDRRPILLLDSGIGGLSVVAAIRRLLPTAPLVYVADRAGFPYGTKSEDEIARRIPPLVARVAAVHDPRLIVIACNTASTIALDAVRALVDLPIVGTVPAIRPAAAISRTRVIGVLGTEATVRQPYVDDLAARYAADCLVLRHGSAELVMLAEARLAGTALPAGRCAAILAGLFDQPGGDRIDVVVNACTHFPLLLDELVAAAPAGVRFVDGADGIGRRVAALTVGQDWPELPRGTALFTGSGAGLAALVPALACHGLSEVATLTP